MELSRRGFIGTMIGGVAASAAVRAWPFRVFSFPESIKVAQPLTVRFIRAYDYGTDKMVSRWDMLSGFGALVHGGVGEFKMIETNSFGLSHALDQMEVPQPVKVQILQQNFPREPFAFGVEHPS
jgi:hypothetical protein